MASKRTNTVRQPLVILGIPELDAKLKALQVRGKKIYQDAAKKGLVPVRARAQSLAPKRTGRLKSKMKIRVLPRSRRRIGARIIIGEGDFRGKTFYASFQEWGWKTGKRRSRNNLPRRKIEGKFFLKQTADDRKDEAVKIFEKELRNSIDALMAQRMAHLSDAGIFQ